MSQQDRLISDLKNLAKRTTIAQEALDAIAQLTRERDAAVGREPFVWVVKWRHHDGDFWFQSHMSEIQAIDHARRCDGEIIPCAPLSAPNDGRTV